MAQVGELAFSTRRECLEACAKTLGVYYPRPPVPEWWDSFERWYQEVRADGNLRSEDDESITSLMIRLDPIEYDDEGEEAFEEDDHPEYEIDDTGCDDEGNIP